MTQVQFKQIDSTRLKNTFQSTQFDSSYKLHYYLMLTVGGRVECQKNRILSSVNWFAQVNGRGPTASLAMFLLDLTHICLSRLKSDS